MSSTICAPQYQWSEWGPCLPCYSAHGTRSRVRACTSCCENSNATTEQTESCHDCQCEITEDIKDKLGFVPEDKKLGTIENTTIIVEIGTNGTTYLETNATVIGYCYYCQCLYNGSLVCYLNNCTCPPWSEWTPCTCDTPTQNRTRQPITMPGYPSECDETTEEKECPSCSSTTTSPTTTPLCETIWTTWTQCPDPGCGQTAIRTRSCLTSNPNCYCNGGNGTETQHTPCPCTTVSTTMPTTSTECPLQGCFDPCNQTCRYYRDGNCSLTTPNEPDCQNVCLCPLGYRQDERGHCVEEHTCPCYHDGVFYPLGFTLSYPDRCERCECNDQNRYFCYPIPGCCIYGEWSNWTSCDVNCGLGVRTRRRVAVNPAQCPQEDIESKSCNGPCVCNYNGTDYPNGTTWTPIEHPCYVCSCDEGNITCRPDRDKVVNGSWTTWNEWSVCAGDTNCRDYLRIRCRACQEPECGGMECEGPAIDTEPCNTEPCCDIYQWSRWTDCSVTCGGNGVRTRYKTYSDNATTQDCYANREEQTCGHCECGDMDGGSWQEWSSCTTDNPNHCGWGKRFRQRQGQACENVDLKEEEECFISPCECKEGFEYTNHTDCHPSCTQQYPDPHCRLTIEPGCVCSGPMYLNGEECVPQHRCNECHYNNQTYQEGERWTCGCSWCQCCGGQTIPTERKCNDTRDCDLNTHRIEHTNDTCCPYKCVPKKCELFTKPPANINITIPSVGDCVTTSPIVIQYCRGECVYSEHHINYATSSLAEKECRCCTARILTTKNVEIACPDNTFRTHTVPILDACECTAPCPT